MTNNPKEKLISLKQLKQLCDEYDDSYGDWPDSQWEGKAVYGFILGQLYSEERNNSFIKEFNNE